MIRAFVAITPPVAVCDALIAAQEGLPQGWRAADEAQFHLTLVFLGALSRPDLEDVALALAALRGAPFRLQLSGFGAFGGAEPRTLWAGFAPCPALAALQAQVAQAARGAGVEIERRRFTPHLTLARTQGRPGRVETERWIARHAGLDGPEWVVNAFGLWRSELGRHGAVHTLLDEYPLGCPGLNADGPGDVPRARRRRLRTV
ncbi:MAG: RNA 2',3'-cyclic phosphodiesterase [Alphaproteobacteria bacterium HGW-Alphaproteobacteria-2]|nr:MAG: RNA 2',3'-cyclic phosphodiesterase [Alphaproteobacteria bacterium HGW-Alphaproteobacteria-2]